MASTVSAMIRRNALGPRTLTAVVGIPIVIGALWMGGAWWLVLLAVVVALAAMELGPLRGLSPRVELTLRIAALFALVIVATAPGRVGGWVVFAWALLMLALGLTPLRSGRGGPSAVASVVFGVAYLAGPLGLLARWRLEHAPWSVLAFLLVIWANDIAAYFIGLAAGRHKLAPRISPAKSWEGAAAGLAAGMGLGALAARWLGLAAGSGALWGGAVTVASQAGDLFESAMKRRAGVKDSGTILPGHGGVLDRIDGILFAAPVGYALLRWLQP